jgi:hypothetical protein
VSGQPPAGQPPSGQRPGGAPEAVHELAGRRTAARQARDFATADELRDQIGQLGWLVADTEAGYELAPAAAPARTRTDARAYPVLATPAALPPAGPADGRVATIALLVEGWPDDLRECVTALLAHASARVKISALDVGNRDGAGDVLQELADAHPGRIEARHVAASPGWSAGRNALLRADPAPAHVIMETSTILTGDAISPLLAALTDDEVVAAGWRGADPDPDLRGFHDAGPGPVTALLGYLLAVRAEAGRAAGGLPARARFYRNADLEFSLRLGRGGRLVVPDGRLPVRQTRHRGYHDSDPDYRDRESRRNYRRVLELLRSGQGGDSGRSG